MLQMTRSPESLRSQKQLSSWIFLNSILVSKETISIHQEKGEGDDRSPLKIFSLRRDRELRVYLEKLSKESVTCVGLEDTHRRCHKFSTPSPRKHRRGRLHNTCVVRRQHPGHGGGWAPGERFYSSSLACRRTKWCSESRSLLPLCSLTFCPPRKSNNVG